MRVLVCGGRNYSDSARVRAVLDKLDGERWINTLIEGGANGADKLAAAWANDHGIFVETYGADWETHGSFAGPMRNKRMIDEGQPDLVVAFPGGRGTGDMVRKARKAGVKVVEISP